MSKGQGLGAPTVMTRRDFIGGTASISLGAALSLGAQTLLQGSSAVAQTISPPVISQVALMIDGAYAGTVDRVVGGEAFLRPALDAGGKIAMAAGTERLVLGFAPPAMNGNFFKWLKASTTTTPGLRASVLLIYYDRLTNKEVHRLSLTGARIVEVAAPSFNASSQERMLFSLHIDADGSKHEKPGGSVMAPIDIHKITNVQESFFRMYVQDREATGLAITSIDRLAMKLYTATNPPRWVPDTVQARIRFTSARPFFDWANDVQAGKASPAQGVVQILNQDFSKVLGTVDLTGMAPLRLTVPEIGLGGTAVGVNAEFYCSSLAFNLGTTS